MLVDTVVGVRVELCDSHVGVRVVLCQMRIGLLVVHCPIVVGVLVAHCPIVVGGLVGRSPIVGGVLDLRGSRVVRTLVQHFLLIVKSLGVRQRLVVAPVWLACISRSDAYHFVSHTDCLHSQ